MNDNPIDRAHASVQRFSCTVDQLLGVKPISEPDARAITNDEDAKRDFFHGYLPGDRVTICRGDTYQYGNPQRQPGSTIDDTPFAYGHVTDIRRGCRWACKHMCRLVAVNIEGAIPLPSGNTITITPGKSFFRLDQVNHAD